MPRLHEFFVVWLLIALAPGATAMMVMAQGLRGGMKKAFQGLLGLQCGHVFFLSLLYLSFRLSGSGFTQLLPWAQKLGALYLVWIGLRFLWSAYKPAAPGAPPKLGSDRYFLQAFLTQISNPQALVFTFALLPGYLSADLPLSRQILTLAAIMMPVDLGVMSVYAWIASKGGEALRSRGRLLDLAAGSMILYVGARLLWKGLRP